MNGSEILAKALREQGVEVIFFLMGGPMTETALACEQAGIRMIDTRHEQAAAMMAQAYGRTRRQPGVCMACSGPGTLNLLTGVANAWVDSAPVVAIGGSSMVSQYGMLSFQETDQVALFRPITRWAERCYEARRIPELVSAAFRNCFSSRPGPVYLDMPGDMLAEEVSAADVEWRVSRGTRDAPPHGAPAAIEDALNLLMAAERPTLIIGSGALWSSADEAIREFVDLFQVPFWSTPQARGIISDRHPLSFPAARSSGFSECDVIIQVGTRQSHIINFALPPRWNRSAKLIQIDIDSSEIGRNRPADVAIVGDARSVIQQLIRAAAGRVEPDRYAVWVAQLRAEDARRRKETDDVTSSRKTGAMHPLRLCQAVSAWMPDDAILVADGNEILNYARQSIEFQSPTSLNSGPYGCMGVGVPFGIGAKIARPSSTVVVLEGDGSFGMNGMELDTAKRHRIPIVCVVSNNGGWTAADRYKVGRDLGFTRYERMFREIGCYSDYVEDPDALPSVLEAAVDSGEPALVNVITDPYARARSRKTTAYET